MYHNRLLKGKSENGRAFLTGDGVVTNTSFTANVNNAVAVKIELDYEKNEVTYTIAGTVFGPYAATAGAKRVTAVSYVGGTSVTSLAGTYRYEGVDTKPFSVDVSTWVKGSDLLAGDFLGATLDSGSRQGFFRVIVSATAP